MKDSEIKSLANYLAFMYGIEERGLIGNISTWNNSPMFDSDADELLNQKLPVDVQIGSGTNKAGTTVRTLALRIKAVNDAKAHVELLDACKVAEELKGIEQ